MKKKPAGVRARKRKAPQKPLARAKKLTAVSEGAIAAALGAGYEALVQEISEVLEAGRHQAAWSLNSIMSATYWEIGRRIVAFEQQGKQRADYGERVIEELSRDLKNRYGRGFGRSTLFQIRSFYIAYEKKVQTLSGQFHNELERNNLQIVQTLSGQFAAFLFRRSSKGIPASLVALRSAGVAAGWARTRIL